MRPRLPVLALVLSLSAVTACGGEDGLSEEEFIAQGDAVCEKLNEEGEALPQPTAEGVTEEYLESLIGLAKGTREDLADLDAPADAEELQTDMVQAYDQVVELLESASAAAGTGDTEETQKKMEELAAEAEAARKDGKSVAERVEEYGFQSCGADL